MGSQFRSSVLGFPEALPILRNSLLTRPGAAFFAKARRLPIVIAIHAALILLSSYLAGWLRFDGNIPSNVMAMLRATLPWTLAIRGLVFVPFGLYAGLWRYTGIWDLSRIVLAVLMSSVLLQLLVYRHYTPAGFPRSLVIIDSILLISFVGGIRLLRRVMKTPSRSGRGRRVLIVGAGNAGEMIVREMRRGDTYQPVGFVDDNPAKVGRTIHGVPVLGTREDLQKIVTTTKPGEVLVAVPSAKAAALRSIVNGLEAFKLPITTLPGIDELVNGKVGVQHIRPLAIEDLLPRSPVALNADEVRHLIRGKRVLVTGAGGSIGSELCRQIAVLAPESLILFERYENSLYAITNDLSDRSPGLFICPIIGDVTDAQRVDAVFAEHEPQLVFHAAAHKHVPLMESNPCEAVKNNVLGTQMVAEASRRYAVERFVLISTDKAANPSSVMGATKRVAELVVQAASRGSNTRFVAVRFGNVLGSNGSVIPRMIDQIRVGGPVTVTHPEIRRYFMLIPEAVELVLQAAVLARDVETFVLDMGEQLKVLDVARNLIRLSGYVPHEEIPITFTGLRPGEKLMEELVGEGEALEPAGVSKIFRVQRPPAIDFAAFGEQVAALVNAATVGETDETLVRLRRTVPTFRNPAGAGQVAVPPRRTTSRALTMVPGSSARMVPAKSVRQA